MSLREDLLKLLETKKEGYRLAELYGFFNTVDLLKEIQSLSNESKIMVINSNRIKLIEF